MVGMTKQEIVMKSEYDLIRYMNGNTYKLLNIIRIMTKEGNTDLEGFVILSHAKINQKMGVGNNITRILKDLEKFPEVVEIRRGDTTFPNRFRLKEEFKIL